MGNNVKSMGKAAQTLAGMLNTEIPVDLMRVSRRVVTGPGSPADPGIVLVPSLFTRRLMEHPVGSAGITFSLKKQR